MYLSPVLSRCFLVWRTRYSNLTRHARLRSFRHSVVIYCLAEAYSARGCWKRLLWIIVLTVQWQSLSLSTNGEMRLSFKLMCDLNWINSIVSRFMSVNKTFCIIYFIENSYWSITMWYIYYIFNTVEGFTKGQAWKTSHLRPSGPLETRQRSLLLMETGKRCGS